MFRTSMQHEGVQDLRWPDQGPHVRSLLCHSEGRQRPRVLHPATRQSCRGTFSESILKNSSHFVRHIDISSITESLTP
jgi:hypothetical protein